MFLLINKPVGITSHDVVDRVRAITGERKVGHAGTLDPFADGLLIVGVGRDATKRLGMFLKRDKRYRASIYFGAVSDTQDVTGSITSYVITSDSEEDGGIPHVRLPAGRQVRDDVNKVLDDMGGVRDGAPRPSRDDVVHMLAHFIGDIEQIPPMYSAKKIGGKQLYKLARAGKEIERPAHAVTIYSIELVSYAWPRAVIDVHCSSGTYIRTLCADIGERLGVGAYCASLTRTAIGDVVLDDAIDLDKLTRENWQLLKKDLA